MLKTANTSPASIRQQGIGVHRAARMAGLAGGIPAVHDDQMPAVPDRLVFKLPPELTEARIEHRFSQLGFRKALDAQVLNADAFVVAHEIRGDLVQKIAFQ